MIEPEFPEDEVSIRPKLSVVENQSLDIKTVQKDRAQTMRGYPFVTFDEMDVELPAKQWLIKGILARGETSAWIAPPGAMKSALLARLQFTVSMAGIGLVTVTRARQAWSISRSSGQTSLSAACGLTDAYLV